MGLFGDIGAPSGDGSYHICLTGHRPSKLDGYRLNTHFYSELRDELGIIIDEELGEHPLLTLHSGLALGADTVWSQAILAAIQRHPGQIKFVAEVPFMEQANRWPAKSDREFWQEQMDAADTVNVYADSYSPQAMKDRNEGMVRASSLVIAVWDGSTGGTHHAVQLAKKMGIETERISPERIWRRVARRHGYRR